MIRVGIGKPRLTFVPGHNDMSHYFPSHWEVNDYFYMSLDDYMQKRAFDKFDMNPKDLDPKDVQGMVEKVNSGKKIDHVEAMLNPAMAYAYRMQQMIDMNPNKSLLWAFNAINKNLDGWVRQVVVLGENRLARWTWHDAYVKLPYLKAKARMLNYLNRGKAKKEWDDWQKFLDNMHKEKKNG